MTTLLILGIGNRDFKRYMLKSLLDGGYRVILLDSVAPDWVDEYVVDKRAVDLLDSKAVMEAAISLHKIYKFSGVYTFDEWQVETTARLARRLGLPGLTEEAAFRCRDKHAMRSAFAAAGVPSAASSACLDVGEAIVAANAVGYPVVIKPRNLAASIGVVRANCEEELRSYFADVQNSRYPNIPVEPGVLIEEYLEGPEFSVECVVQDGKTHVCGITEKTVGFAPFFLEMGHLAPPVGSDTRHDRIIELVHAAHAALDVRFGATHVELRYTSRGPCVIEVAARLGGDRIPYITKLSSGIDVVAASAASVTGGEVSVTPTIGRIAGIRMIYPEYDGVVRALGVSDAREKIWTEIGWWATVGQRVRLPPRSFTSRLAYVMAVGDSREEVQRRLGAAEEALSIVVEADLRGPSD